jgi:hypothetical protein
MIIKLITAYVIGLGLVFAIVMWAIKLDDSDLQ